MTLSSLIRKRDTANIATAIPAIPAIPTTRKSAGGGTVAKIARIAVAKSPQEKTAPPAKVADQVTATAYRWWLLHYPDRDPVEVACCAEATHADILERHPGAVAAEPFTPTIPSGRYADAREYFTGRAAAELPKPDPFPDDRRTCDQCANLIARRCQAAKRGEIVASRIFEPIRDLPRRCEGYALRPPGGQR